MYRPAARRLARQHEESASAHDHNSGNQIRRRTGEEQQGAGSLDGDDGCFMAHSVQITQQISSKCIKAAHRCVY
jgi:hypothetical protein